MKRHSLLSLVFLMATGSSIPCQVKVASSAPSLDLKEVLQAPEETHGTWEELRGRAVVVEFWATWCGGCVDNIAHMNELADRFASRPLQFISITDENDVDSVKRFLDKHPIRGWVAFDANESTFKKYEIVGRPRTLLVNASGIVQGITNPASITPQVLEDLLNGRPLNFPEVRMGPILGLEAGAPPPLVQVLIRPAAPVEVSGTSPGGVIDENGRYDVYGYPLLRILSEVYEVPESRVDAPAWCSKASYDYSVVTPQHEERLRDLLLKQALESAFQLRVRKEKKDTQVYILSAIQGHRPKLRVATMSGKSIHWNPGKGNLEAMSASIDTIVHVAHFVLGKDILDETGLTERYDFEFKWNPNQPTSLVTAISDQLGLDLVTANRNLDHLVVDSIQEPKTW
jgi:uncharacterized protein (TIGR03435 family)